MLCVILLSVGHGVYAAEDPDIIIYSNSHGPETYTMQKAGILKIGITSINPIVKLSINDHQVEMPRDSRIDISHPFTLQPGENSFLVQVVTDVGEKEKTFIVNYGGKPKPKKPVFQLIAILGVTGLDNVTNATENDTKLSGSKTSITAVPLLNLMSGGNSELKLKAILLREVFSKEDFNANEISYTQLAVQFKLKETFLGEIQAEIGLNDIRTDNENPLLGKDETVSETFVSGMLKQKIGAKDNWNVKLEYKMKDSKAEVTDVDVDADAAVITLKGALNLGFGGLRSTVKAGYESHDAKGQYIDSSSMNLGVKLKYPLGDLIPSVGFNTKIKTLAVENPSIGNL